MRGHEELRVVVGGDVVGRVRVDGGGGDPGGEVGGDLLVLEAELVTPAHAAVLGSMLECRAIADRAGQVVLDGDAGALGLLVDAGWAEVVSQRLRRDLGEEPTPPAPAPGGGVRLAPMGAETFELFRESTAEGYVAARAGTGEPPDQARRVGLAQLDALLPDGLDSPDQHLFTGWAGSTPVGHLWLGTERHGAFVYKIEVAEEERRRGHGGALMRAAEAWAREQGHDHVCLNVFAPNTAARALYAALGYLPVHTTYARPVGA